MVNLPFTRMMTPLLLPWLVRGALVFSAWHAPSPSTAQEARYSILKGSSEVGAIAVSREVTGGSVDYRMDSRSEFDLIWPQRVRTMVRTSYQNGLVHGCQTMVYLNGSLRDSSHMRTMDGRAHCFVHPDDRFQQDADHQWTTARMYFEEPLLQDTILVESVLQPRPLLRTGAGRYTLVMPNGDKNHYVYRGGVLMEVHVDRTMVDLLFRRL